MNEDLTESTPQKSNRRMILAGGVSAVLLGCCALFVVAAIIIVADPFGLNIFSRLTGRYDAAAAAMPADTVFYAGVNLLNLDAQEIRRISQPFIQAAGDPQVENLDNFRNEFSEEIESEFGISVETDVVPWIGQHVGFGVTGVVFDNFGEVESVDWILTAEARNRDAADQFITKLRDNLADYSDAPVIEQSYEGVTFYGMQGGGPFGQIAFGRSGGLVILGANAAAIQSAVDAQNGDSLDESQSYRQILGDLPRGRALTVFAMGDTLRELLSQTDGVTGVPVNLSGLPLTGFTSAATTISIVEVGLQIDMVSYFDPEQLSPAQQALLEAGGRPAETAELFPDQTLALVSGQRLDLFWLAIRESTGDEAGFDESMDAFAQEFGLNPSEELFPLLNGEWAVGVIAGQSGLMADQLDVPLGFSFVAATDRPQEMAGTIEAVRAGLAGQLLIVNESGTAGSPGYQVSFGEDLPPAFIYGLEQDYFFIASTEGAAAETFAGGSPLSQDEQFRAVSAELANGLNLNFYLNVSAILGTLRESGAGFELFSNEAVRVFEPIQAVAVGNAYDDNLRRSQLLIFIETE